MPTGPFSFNPQVGVTAMALESEKSDVGDVGVTGCRCKGVTVRC